MKRIWIFDDDEGIVEAMEILLTESGYEVSKFLREDGFNQAIQKDQPDLLLIDILISGVDGRDVVKRLRTGKTTQNLPIIIISANSKALEEGKNLGVTLMKKPFDIYDLLEKINSLTSS